MTRLGPDTVEGFAALCASLDDGFWGRAMVLAQAGLREGQWDDLQRYWIDTIQADPSVAHRFAVAYASARGKKLAGDEQPITPEPEGQRSSSLEPSCAGPTLPPLEEDTGREELDDQRISAVSPVMSPIPWMAPPLPLVVNGEDTTLECPAHVTVAPLPFIGAQGPSPAGVPSAPRAALLPPSWDGHTQVLPAYSPEQPISTTGAAPPGKMLARFDPNTGAPLSAPIWIDVPPTTTRK